MDIKVKITLLYYIIYLYVLCINPNNHNDGCDYGTVDWYTDIVHCSNHLDDCFGW